MPRRMLGTDVFNQAIDRMRVLYEAGHRIVVSFSGGKDSCCVLEVCIVAATETGRLPVEIVVQDEEIAFPGTYEYIERTFKRPEVKGYHLVMRQPMINVFNRKEPYFWVFDPLLAPEQWVRQPPSWAIEVPEKDISMMTIPSRFPPPAGKELYAVIGLRIQESQGRMYGLFSSGGYLTKPNRWGVRSARPIYDWQDGDVWKAVKDNGWDYNGAYDILYGMGVPRNRLRVAPPTMNAPGVSILSKAAAAWPQWFDKVCERLPGVRSAAQYGLRAVTPKRKLGESWEACFKRECITEAPAPWIAERAQTAMEKMLSAHAHHSTSPFPEVEPCYTCFNRIGSWRNLALALYGGDPFSTKCGFLPYVDPEFFRKGAGYWLDKPSW